MARGRLRIYLGAAPGVGKTVAMLSEGRRRLERGTDVVVGVLETHGRAFTAAQADGIEVVPPRAVDELVGADGAPLTELDVDAVLRRRPAVALVDELAHTNAAGSPRAKRWQDVEVLLDAGVDVVSTVDIHSLESLSDVVQAITGTVPRDTVPDEVVRSADQVELVDMSPEALRRRLAHGNIYPPDRVDAALSDYFRPGNLSALRELALLWLADRVEETLERYRRSHGISRTWPTRERIVVGLTDGPESETVLRRAAQIASRGAGSELLACHVSRPGRPAHADPETRAAQRRLVAELGGVLHEVEGSDVAEAVLYFARGVNATQVVLGTSRGGPFAGRWRRGVGEQVAAASGDIDVHLVGHSSDTAARLRWGGPGLGMSRLVAGWLLATVGLAALTALLLATLGRHELPLEVLLYLALTVATALAGGLPPALFCAVASSLVINWFFTEPVGSLTIQSPQNALALGVFVVVAVAVASVVHRAARRRDVAVRAQRESRTLLALAQSLLAEADPLPALVERARRTFGMRGAALVSRPSVRDPWTLVAAAGDVDLGHVAEASVRQTVDEDTELVLVGPVLPATERRLVAAFASHAAALLTRERLVAEARRAKGLARDNRARTALLAAVSHDLRTPLASIKAAVSSLRQHDVRFTPEDEAALLESVEESADRLGTLIGNLLDMSRIQTDTITPNATDVLIDEAVAAARSPLAGGERVRTRFEEDVPPVRADVGLLDRVLENVLENALRHSPGRREVVVQASRLGERVQIRVVDRGPGVPDAVKAQMFAPFQRGGDVPRGDGVGLGLAVARGLTEAMGGALWAEDTPGGGLTIVVELPRAPGTTTATSARAATPARKAAS